VEHGEECRIKKAQTAYCKFYGQGGRHADTTDLKPQGRWPANLIHDGSEEVVALFPQTGKSARPQSLGRKYVAKRNVYSSAGPKPHNSLHADSGSAARFFYCAKASRAEKDAGCEGSPLQEGGFRSETSGQHITRRDGGAPGPVRNNHPTVKPLSLMEYLCKLTRMPTGGIVFDPFAGSGSTCVAAKKIGRRYIGIDMDEHNCEIGRARVKAAEKPLFPPEPTPKPEQEKLFA